MDEQCVKRDLLLEINPHRGTVRIDLHDQEEDETEVFTVSSDVIDVESIADVERYQCFTFPEQPFEDLRIDKVSMSKKARVAKEKIIKKKVSTRWDSSDEEDEEVCEMGPLVYTLKITTANEKQIHSDNMQATIVFSGKPRPPSPLVSDDDGHEITGEFEKGVIFGSQGSYEEGDYDSYEDDEYDSYEEEEYGGGDFIVEESDTFTLHNLKRVGKVECIFVTRATDEVWHFHEIKVTRVKHRERSAKRGGEVAFKPVSNLYSRARFGAPEVL